MKLAPYFKVSYSQSKCDKYRRATDVPWGRDTKTDHSKIHSRSSLSTHATKTLCCQLLKQNHTHTFKRLPSFSVSLLDHILCDSSSAFSLLSSGRHEWLSKDLVVIRAVSDAEVLCSVCSHFDMEGSRFRTAFALAYRRSTTPSGWTFKPRVKSWN